MAKTIKFEMSAKDAKTIAAAAEILQRIVTPAEEPVVAVIEEAPAKAKKTAVKKDATAKKTDKKPAKKSNVKKTVKASSQKRLTIPMSVLDKVDLRGAQVKIMKQKGVKNAFYMAAATTPTDKKFTVVKTLDLPWGQGSVIYYGDMVDAAQGHEFTINIKNNMIEIVK